MPPEDHDDGVNVAGVEESPTDAAEPARQLRGEESKTAFLEAGAALLNERQLEPLLSTRAIATRAQRTTGSFFHYWPDLERYMDDLLDYVMRPGSVPLVDDVGSMLDDLVTEDMRPVQLIRALCEHDLRESVYEPLLRTQMLLWSKHKDPRAREAVARFYERTDSMFAEKFQQVVAAWNRDFRTPFDVEAMATIFTAVLEGLAIRRVVQPERVPAHLFGDVVLALIPVLLRAEDDNRTLDDLASEIDRYPTRPVTGDDDRATDG